MPDPFQPFSPLLPSQGAWLPTAVTPSTFLSKISDLCVISSTEQGRQPISGNCQHLLCFCP